MTIRVVLADDHPTVRAGIRNILNRAEGIRVVGEAANGGDALKLARELSPDVLVLDVEMPEMRGTEVLKRLKREGDLVPILTLSAYDDRHFILEMLGNGSNGYLVKDEAPAVIVQAIRSISHGEKGWVSNQVALRIAVWLLEEMPRLLDLDDRQVAVLEGVQDDLRVDEIGRRLNMSRTQVRREIRGIVRSARNCIKDRRVLTSMRNLREM